MRFDTQTCKDVADHLNRTILEEKVKLLVRQEIEKLEARVLLADRNRSDQGERP